MNNEQPIWLRTAAAKAAGRRVRRVFTDQYKRTLAAQSLSTGLTLRAFAKQHDVAVSVLCGWRRVHRAGGFDAANKPTEVSRSISEPKNAAEQQAATAVEIRLARGTAVFTGSPPADLVRAIIDALQ